MLILFLFAIGLFKKIMIWLDGLCQQLEINDIIMRNILVTMGILNNSVHSQVVEHYGSERMNGWGVCLWER